jgi:hypothetical protein
MSVYGHSIASFESSVLGLHHTPASRICTQQIDASCSAAPSAPVFVFLCSFSHSMYVHGPASRSVVLARLPMKPTCLCWLIHGGHRRDFQVKNSITVSFLYCASQAGLGTGDDQDGGRRCHCCFFWRRARRALPLLGRKYPQIRKVPARPTFVDRETIQDPYLLVCWGGFDLA